MVQTSTDVIDLTDSSSPTITKKPHSSDSNSIRDRTGSAEVTKIKKEEHLRRESIGSLGRKSAILATTSMKTSILSDSADDDEEEYELEGEDEEDDDDD
eukprot:CAMPEP_0119048162 /NCGR_PEP_ID=MMETSP1177-20130426/57381_1 /TAXON_ID=2985 /ORGANISM="Ochromonas sp, Strain CCMP1899" /LENGTH=98 /DNA_ID=CAMNT_0007023697 /DNA_START=42 /DNA_END=335 /DNA_ORIENTATION=-